MRARGWAAAILLLPVLSPWLFSCQPTLPKGTRIEVLEKVAGLDWYRIAQDGKPLGFVYAPLVEPALE